MAAELHLAIDALALQLLLERPQRLVDIVIANDDLHKSSPLFLVLKTQGFWKNCCRETNPAAQGEAPNRGAPLTQVSPAPGASAGPSAGPRRNDARGVAGDG